MTEVSTPLDWAQLARDLHDRQPLPPRPATYDPDALRALHQHDPAAARAVMRQASGWSYSPHDDRDFFATLQMWEHGHQRDELDDPDDPECHFVGVDRATFGCGKPCEVAVANCKDCGLPVYRRGGTYLLALDDDAPVYWRAIWPPAGTHDIAVGEHQGSAR